MLAFRLLRAELVCTLLCLAAQRTAGYVLRYLGEHTIPFGWHEGKDVFGGISALARHPNGEILAVSDHPNTVWPANISVGVDGDVRVDVGVPRKLLTPAGVPFGKALDVEGAAWLGSAAGGTELLVSTERDKAGAPSRIARFGSDLRWKGPGTDLPVPKFYGGARGDHVNKGFEGLAVSPDGRFGYVVNEFPLVRDGDAASHMVRVTKLAMPAGTPLRTVAYMLERVAVGENGVSELLALDNADSLLAVERAYAKGVGNTVRLFQFNASHGPDVSACASLQDDSCKGAAGVPKALLADMSKTGAEVKNYEGACLGPRLANGARTVLIVDDNNFNPAQGGTNFVAFSLTTTAEAAHEATMEESEVAGALLVGLAVWWGVISLVMARHKLRVLELPEIAPPSVADAEVGPHGALPVGASGGVVSTVGERVSLLSTPGSAAPLASATDQLQQETFTYTDPGVEEEDECV